MSSASKHESRNPLGRNRSVLQRRTADDVWIGNQVAKRLGRPALHKDILGWYEEMSGKAVSVQCDILVRPVPGSHVDVGASVRSGEPRRRPVSHVPLVGGVRDPVVSIVVDAPVQQGCSGVRMCAFSG